MIYLSSPRTKQTTRNWSNDPRFRRKFNGFFRVLFYLLSGRTVSASRVVIACNFWLARVVASYTWLIGRIGRFFTSYKSTKSHPVSPIRYQKFSIFSSSSKNWSHFYYQFFETLTDRGVSRVNYEVPRLSKLHEDARRCSKDFQQVWYELKMFKVCRDDMPCEVKKPTIWYGGFLGGLKNEKVKVEKFISPLAPGLLDSSKIG